MSWHSACLAAHRVEVGQTWFVWAVCLDITEHLGSLEHGVSVGLFFTSRTKSSCALVPQSTWPLAVHGLMNAVLIGLLFVYGCCHSAAIIQWNWPWMMLKKGAIATGSSDCFCFKLMHMIWFYSATARWVFLFTKFVQTGIFWVSAVSLASFCWCSPICSLPNSSC